jgi:REP element-mobilizing transposase RayT
MCAPIASDDEEWQALLDVLAQALSRFDAEDDYSSYLHRLGEALIEAQCALHACVLMTNHLHSIADAQARRSRAQAGHSDKGRWSQPRGKAERGEP